MKRSYVIAGGIALAVVAWLATGLLEAPPAPPAVSTTSPDVSADVSTGGAEPPAQAVQVVGRRAEAHRRTIVLFGRTRAERRVDVRAETTGRVSEKLVLKGQRVAAGDVLVRLAMDDREAQVRQARALVEQWQAAYRASRTLRRDGFSPELKMAEDLARLEEARARLAVAELDVARTAITAPFAGIVEDVPVEIGTYVQTGGPDGSSIVATLVDLEPLVVVASVTERDGPAVSAGTVADIRLVTGETLTGSVRFVASVANPQTRTFDVEIEAPNPGGRVPEGVTAEVVLHAGEVIAHRLSPAVLTLNDDGMLGVKAVGDDDRVVFHRVAIIDDTPDGIWLTGLPDAVTLIVVGQEFVREGQRVTPVPASDLATATGGPR